MLEFQNKKTFLLKDTLQIVQKKRLLLVGLKIQFRGIMSNGKVMIIVLIVGLIKKKISYKNESIFS